MKTVKPNLEACKKMRNTNHKIIFLDESTTKPVVFKIPHENSNRETIVSFLK